MRAGAKWARWTAAEEEILRALYPAHTDGEIAARLERSPKAIAHRREQLGLVSRRARCWTMSEREALIAMYGAYTAGEIAERLERTRAAVYYQVHALGLPHWTTRSDEQCAL